MSNQARSLTAAMLLAVGYEGLGEGLHYIQRRRLFEEEPPHPQHIGIGMIPAARLAQRQLAEATHGGSTALAGLVEVAGHDQRSLR